MSIKILTDNLKNNEFSSLYYIYGEEEYLKEYYYNELKKKCVTEFVEFNVIEFEAKKFDYIDFTNCVNSYPIMSEKKFIGVVDFEFTSQKESFLKEFTEFLKNIPEYCVVTFFDSELKSSKSTALEKCVSDADGLLVKVDRPNSAFLSAWMSRHFKKAGKSVSADAAKHMLSIADNDMRSLINEITKLCNFSDESEITREQIDLVVTRSIEANQFEIGDAFCSSNYQKIFDILNKMYKQNIDELRIANVFYMAFADLLKAKIALNRAKTSADLVRDFGMIPFVASKMIRNATKLDFDFIAYAVEASKQLDIKLKNSMGNKRDLILIYVGELIDRRRCFAKNKN